MKAKEYFEQYGEGIYNETVANGGTKNISSLIKALLKEELDICEKRHVKLFDGAAAVTREQNDKWNAIANLFVKKYGVEILKQNGYAKWLEYELKRT